MRREHVVGKMDMDRPVVTQKSMFAYRGPGAWARSMGRGVTSEENREIQCGRLSPTRNIGLLTVGGGRVIDKIRPLSALDRLREKLSHSSVSLNVTLAVVVDARHSGQDAVPITRGQDVRTFSSSLLTHLGE